MIITKQKIQYFTIISTLFLLFAQPISAELDLKEANVVGVGVTDLGDGKYDFASTLIHDDDGEAPQFADAWQVETLNGTFLGERILAHSHGTVEFTRSATIEIPSSVTNVVVRAHDQEHGFGGQVAIVRMSDFAVVFFAQGSEPVDLSNITFTFTGSTTIENDTSETEQVSFPPFLMVLPLIVVIKRMKFGKK